MPVVPATPKPAAREFLLSELDDPKPIYAVWELTTRCDQPCQHCGTRAGSARVEELNTEQIKEVGRGLKKLGCREVTLIGGEAYLRNDVEEIISFLSDQGIRVTMQSGGRALTLDRCRRFAAAGLQGLGVSIDGLEAEHDTLRGNKGSHAAALRALKNAQDTGLIVTSNMQINRLNMHTIQETSVLLRDHRVRAWQVQLTTPMGNAADHPDWILQPTDVVPVIDTLAAIQLDAVQNPRPWEKPRPLGCFNVQAANNIGYFGPHEEILRSRPGGSARHWIGCGAGRAVIGIESDGTVKGCPSLPTAPYTGGNVKDLGLEQIWKHADALNFARKDRSDELWGYCKRCYYADICRAGCSFTAHTILGKRGNNPLCYHRAVQLEREGIRERLVQVQQAEGERYDFGRFEIVEEGVPRASGAPAAPKPLDSP